jgi:hypothetical protein
MNIREIEHMWKIASNNPNHDTNWHDPVVVAFAKLVAQHEREACAKVAGWLWQQFQDTKEAHERNSPEPFRPERFGFDQSTVQQSKRLMDAIRARGQA